MGFLVKLFQSCKIIHLAAGEAPGVLKSFGWKAGALQRDRLCAEAQLHQGVGHCWVVTEGDKCPYREGSSSLGCFSPACKALQSHKPQPLKNLKGNKKKRWLGGKKGFLQVMAGGKIVSPLKQL